ncbi:MAG: hypothetical protein P4L44_04930 [Oryzomonas sp.]|uniref:hypothetical protein n=1 Tax=Oryzomonas sp. TaxID=2855186 RepID=UPI00284DF589|nr:hypothetical protein [Oryzomonas sp.]MDR3579289.1 hypothetical protein [Oryzomonas sp.]
MKKQLFFWGLPAITLLRPNTMTPVTLGGATPLLTMASLAEINNGQAGYQNRPSPVLDWIIFNARFGHGVPLMTLFQIVISLPHWLYNNKRSFKGYLLAPQLNMGLLLGISLSLFFSWRQVNTAPTLSPHHLPTFHL